MLTKCFIVALTSEERKRLEEIVSKGTAAAYRIEHANILRVADVDGPNMNDDDIASAFRCHRNTVANVRQRFVEQDLDAALNRKKREFRFQPSRAKWNDTITSTVAMAQRIISCFLSCWEIRAA